MAGMARRHGTTMDWFGSIDFSNLQTDVVAAGENIWGYNQPDTLTQPDNTPISNLLTKFGDNMTGTFGISSWSTTSGSIYQLPSATQILDVGIDALHASRWVWIADSSNVDKLARIDNAEFDGQLLFIESSDGETPTIFDKDDGTAIADANIKTLDGNDFVFPSTKTIVMLMYSAGADGGDGLWFMVTAGSGIVSLSADQTWTGEQTFDDIKCDDSSASNQFVTTTNGDDSVQFGGYFNVKDSGGSTRKIPYLI